MHTHDEKEFQRKIRHLSEDVRTHAMRHFIQHGKRTTYDHCMDVARQSYRLARGLKIRVDEKALLEGAFLHDYFLYDWHHRGDHLHGYHHPHIAMKNAMRDFHINKKTQNIIESHMWPLTLFHAPASKEAVIVCIADKLCSIRETLHRR